MSWVETIPSFVVAGVLGLVWRDIRSARKEAEAKFLPKVEHDLGCETRLGDISHKIALVKIDVDHQLDIGGRVMGELDKRIEKMDEIIKNNSGT